MRQSDMREGELTVVAERDDIETDLGTLGEEQLNRPSLLACLGWDGVDRD